MKGDLLSQCPMEAQARSLLLPQRPQSHEAARPDGVAVSKCEDSPDHLHFILLPGYFQALINAAFPPDLQTSHSISL